MIYATPTPDPTPGSTKPVHVDWPYEYVTRGQNRITHQVIPGVWFVCYVRPGRSRFCVRFREPEDA